MLSRLAILLVPMTVAAACAERAAPALSLAAAAVPTGATLGPEGYATIRDAPPAPFVPAAPTGPKPATPEQIAAQEQFSRVTRFQARVLPEVHALANHLRVAEKGNFVDFHFDNEGEPRAVFQFLRDGPAIVRKYTNNPGIVGETVRFTKDELMAAMDFMLETFREDRVIELGGIGAENAATIRINVPEEQFRALVARKGVTIPDAVRLEFPVERPASEVNAPLPPDIAQLVRIFPRDDRPTGPVPDTSRTVKVELRDGCFRIADYDNALALFPLGARLFIDDENYLAFGPDEPGYARVGEEAEFHGIPVEVTATELVEPIHAACGPGKVLKINRLRSAAAERAQNRVTTNARALQEFTQSYGLTEAQARKLLERCKRHVGGDVCLTSPPPPVMRAEDCPAGTSFSGGICRTPEGHIRPLPEWLQELLVPAAVTAAPLASYDPAAVTIARQERVHTAGVLTRDGDCLRIETYGQVEGVTAAPIWPAGTRLEGDRLLLPDGTPVPIGERIGLMGRFVGPAETQLAALAKDCPGRPLLIEQANQLFAWRTVAELLDMSDAVLIVEVRSIDPQDPLGDGLLTTIQATVVEPLAGEGYPAGHKLKLRLPSGMDASGRWHASSHDPLYEPFGGLQHQLAGQRLLLFVNQDFYTGQARVRDGQALPGYTGGSFFYRLEGDRIVNEGDAVMAATVDELKREIGSAEAL